MTANASETSFSIAYPTLHAGVWAYELPSENLDSVIMLFGQAAMQLPSKLYQHLVPLLDGSLTTDEIISHVTGQIDEDEARSCLEKLAKGRLIYDRAPDEVANEEWHDLFGLAVSVHVFGALSAEPLVQLLSSRGARISDDPMDANISVALADHYLQPGLEILNLSAEKPWIILGPHGHDMWIGPLFQPGSSACWECLAHRLRMNRKVEQYVWRETGAAQIPHSQSEIASSIMDSAFKLVAQQIANWRNDPNAPVLLDQLAVLDSSKLSIDHHKVTRRPQCNVCGSSEMGNPQPIHLPERTEMQTVPAEGLARGEFFAKKTLEQYAHHISPITGLVQKLIKRTTAPGIHIIKGGRYISKTSDNWSELQTSLNQNAAGKGVSEDEAKASALGESFEWYTLGAPANCQLIQESYTKLSKLERVLQPKDLVHFSKTQMAENDRAMAANIDVQSEVPLAFDPDAPLDWRPVWSLTQREWVYLPASFFSWSTKSPYIACNSNGAAAGPTLEHAILHGFNELVERDAIALWWYNRIIRSSVNLDDLDPKFLSSMRTYQQSLGRDFWLLDITSDLEIPTFAAISIDETGEQTIGQGFGAHSNPKIAATRALTELNQLMPVKGQFVPRADRPSFKVTDLHEISQAHIRPDPDTSPIRLEESLCETTNDIEEDIWAGLERTREMGLEFLVADLTQPDVGMPVVKAVVPGLRHAYKEFAPGRLYDTPVELGWRDQPSTEDEMSKMRSPL